MESQLALVIEDNEDVAFIFARAVEDAGYETEIITSGDKAQQRLADVVPDLVILDLHLPRVDGLELLAEIRDDPRLKETRVMLATADVRKAEELHEAADLVLVKPISYHQLRDLAKRMVRDVP